MNKQTLKKRLVIGTANFTQKYGAHPIKVNINQINKILNLAKKNQIYEIDTAAAYLKNKTFFKKIDKKFQFTSKIIPNQKWSSLEFCQNQLENHIEKFNYNTIKQYFFMI